MKLPDGFAPVTFAAFDAQYPQMLPEVLTSLVGEIKGDSLSDARNVIAKMSEIGVLQFARNATGTPAAFAASDAVIHASLAAPSPVNLNELEVQLGKRLVSAVIKWFDVSGDFDAKTGAIVDDAHPIPDGHFAVPVAQWLQDSSIDANRIATQARLSRHVAAACFLRLEQAGYLRIQRKVGRQPGEPDGLLLTVPDARDLSRSERALSEAMNDIYPMETAGRITFNDGPVRWPKEKTQVKQIQTVRTPTGPLALVRQVAEKLLTEGVISGTLDGDLHAADAATVKAAIMASAVCDFCSSPGATHYFDVPDFGITKNDDPNNYGAAKSTGGWMACDTCDELIRKDRRKQLVDRAVANMAFPKFSRRAIEELYAKFWQGMDDRVAAAGTATAFAEFVDDKMPNWPVDVRKPSARDVRIDEVARTTGMTRAQVEALTHGDIDRDAVQRLTDWNRRFDAKSGTTQQRMLQALAAPHKPLADVVPHWQRALDAKFQAMLNITALVRRADKTLAMAGAIDMNDPAQPHAVAEQAARAQEVRDLGFADDVKSLRVAQAYSFNGETTAAIREAARSVPHEAPLSSIETPNTGAGWFWFSVPWPISGTPSISESTVGLLWSWENVGHESAALRFSAFVVAANADDPTLRNKVLPSTKWWWPLEASFDDMLKHNRKTHRRDYGAGGRRLRDGMSIAPEEETMQVVSELSLFFIMACLWFRQTVPTTGRKIEPKLTREHGPVERQARKRLAKEHGLDALPSVQVVALRKSQRVPAEHAPDDRQTTAREYHCKWIVAGHPRMQACGPGRKDRKLIWIDAFVKGPENAPMRTHEKVFAVIR